MVEDGTARIVDVEAGRAAFVVSFHVTCPTPAKPQESMLFGGLPL